MSLAEIEDMAAESAEYIAFLATTGALGKVVLAASVVERVLAVVFEHEWFERWFTEVIDDPEDGSKKKRVSKLPGLKGVLALAVSIGICFWYKFDFLAIVFPIGGTGSPLGIIITGFVVAGGSAGAIALFQGYLNIGKEAREATIAARKAESEAAKKVAELAAGEAKAKKEEAVAEAATKIAQLAAEEAKAKKEKAEAEAAQKVAELAAEEAAAKKEKAVAEKAEAEARRKIAESEGPGNG